MDAVRSPGCACFEFVPRVRKPRWNASALLKTVFISLSALLATAGVARSEFTVCNQTLDVVNLAVGQEIESRFQTDGWWTIGANQCVNVVREELTNRFIYIYATDVFGYAILGGATDMCIERRRFSIRGIDECWSHGHIAAKFLEVDTKDQARWTFFLTGKAQ